MNVATYLGPSVYGGVCKSEEFERARSEYADTESKN